MKILFSARTLNVAWWNRILLRAEETVRQSEQRYRELLASVTCLIFDGGDVAARIRADAN